MNACLTHSGVAGIMPLYSKRETVGEAIESMLAQTRPPDEIVIVDDGSTDGSDNLVEQRYGKHQVIRLIRQENRGVSAARNAAIRATASPLLAFLDANDKWLPHAAKPLDAVCTCAWFNPASKVKQGLERRLNDPSRFWDAGRCP